MVVDARTSPLPSRPLAASWARVAGLPASVILTGLVALGAALRAIVSLGVLTPTFFPDEYIHAEIARSLAATGRPLVRGLPAHFPALLEPFLAAPFWLVGNVELAYRLTQGMQAVAFALAAVPVYLLSRRLGLGKWFSIGAAAVALACPDGLYSSVVMGTAIAYPLVLGAVYAGVLALERPTWRSQLAFALLSALATLARVQFVVLPLAFLAALVLLERGRPARLWRSWRLSLLLYGAAAVAVVAYGAKHALGYYAGISAMRITGGGVLHWMAVDSMLIAFAAGAALVPGALGGIAGSLLRPKERAATAFAALTVVFAVAILVEAGVYAASGSDRFQERYVFTLFPLLAPAFGIWLRRGRPGRLLVLALAAALVMLPALVPLSGYVVKSGKQDSPFLIAVGRLAEHVGEGDAGFVVALAIGALALLAVVLSLAGRRVAWLALVATVAFGATVSATASRDWALATVAVKSQYFPSGDTGWIDRQKLGRVGELELGWEAMAVPIEQLFWNRSVRDVFLLSGARPVDMFENAPVRVAADGTLLVAGKAVRESLLVPKIEGLAVLTGAQLVAGTALADLWRATGTPRLSLLVRPRYLDGWLGAGGTLTVWGERTGRVRGTLFLTLALPKGSIASTVRLTWPGGSRTLFVAPGTRHLVRIAARSNGPWVMRFSGRSRNARPQIGPGRPISVQARAIRFVPSSR